MKLPSLRTLFASSSLLALAGLPLLLSSVVPAAPGVPVEILKLNQASLTAFKASGVAKDSGQGVKPTVWGRGVGLDGHLRAAPSLRMAVAGNPFKGQWSGTTSISGVDLATGSFAPRETDIALPTTGLPLAISRSYSSRQFDGSGVVDSAGFQGNNWFQGGVPELYLAAGATKDEDIVYLVYGAGSFVEFQRASLTSDEFRGMQGAAGYVKFIAASGGDPETYEYTDGRGTVWTFFGEDSGATRNWEYQFWKAEDTAGNVLYVWHETDAAVASANGYSAGGGPLKMYDADDRRISFTYSSGRLDGV